MDVGCRWWRGVFWGMQLQIARHRVMVGSRWQWVAGSGAVFLGNAIANC